MIYSSQGQRITKEIAAQVFDLRVQELSMREISKTLGIGREIVRKILLGDSLACERRNVIANGNSPLGPKERCPVCGAMVYVPCLLCVKKITQFSPKGVPEREVSYQVLTDPTPEQIEKLKAEIQAGWSEERKANKNQLPTIPFSIPELSMPQTPDCNYPAET